MSHVLSMHMLQRSEHFVCHAPYQPQIIYLTHNEVLTWDGELNSAFIVIFKNVFAFKYAVHMKSLCILSQSSEISPSYGNLKQLCSITMCKHEHHSVSPSRAQLPNVIHIPFVTVLLMNIEAEDRK